MNRMRDKNGKAYDILTNNCMTFAKEAIEAGRKLVSMRFVRWSVVILIATIAAVATYEWLNTAISLNYARQQQKTDESDAEILRKIVLAQNLGRPCGEVELEIRRSFGTDHFDKNRCRHHISR